MDIQINSIKKFIEENLKQEFSLTDIANHVGYSAYHLSREYKKTTGRSIMDYVRERKIFEAAILFLKQLWFMGSVPTPASPERFQK